MNEFIDKTESLRHDYEPPSTVLTSLAEADPNDTTHFGGKATSLARLIRHGVRVPEGYVVSTDVFDESAREGAIPPAYVDEIMAAIDQLGGVVAIRSSANVEDGETSSLAGVFETHYARNPDRDAIIALVTRMYDQARTAEVQTAARLYGIEPSDIKLGLVVQRLIEPTHAGVVYASANRATLIVQYVEGFGEQLVDGSTSGSAVGIDPDDGRITASVNFDKHPLPDEAIRQLVAKTEHIARIFNNSEQDIEFAIDGSGEVYIVQARPLTREIGETTLDTTFVEVLRSTQERAAKIITHEMHELGTEKAMLTLGNFSELLPNPAPMDAGTFQYIFSGYNGRLGAIQLGRQKMGYPISDASVGYMHYIGGQVYESLSRDAGSYYMGFPETEQEYYATLVREYLDIVYADPKRASYPEMGLYLQDPTYEDLEIRFGAEQAARYMQVYETFSANISCQAAEYVSMYREVRQPLGDAFIATKCAENTTELSDDALLQSYYEILEHMRQESCVDFVTTARLGFYYMQNLRQSLVMHTECSGDQVEELLSHLSQGLEGSSVTDFNIEITQAATSEEAYQIALEKISHYTAEGEILQIRHPRMSDDPAQLRRYIEGLRSGDDYATKFEQQKIERFTTQNELLTKISHESHETLATTIERAQQYMALRETAKDQFTREYALLRERLVEIERRSGMDEGQIFYLYPDEVFRFPDLAAVAHLTDARAQEFVHYQNLDMPRILRHDTLHDITQKAEREEIFTEATGQFIAPGEALEGIIVNMDEFENREPGALMELLDQMRQRGERVILVAKQVNLTHDPYINRADGLIIERAGFVSHGAQRARELGVGALSSIISSQLTTGMRVYFDPANKYIGNRGDAL